MRRVGRMLLVVGSAIDAICPIPSGLANLLVTGDLMPAPVVEAWPMPVGIAVAILGIAGVRWDRAAAGAAAVVGLPLVLAVSLGSTGAATYLARTPSAGRRAAAPARSWASDRRIVRIVQVTWATLRPTRQQRRS